MIIRNKSLQAHPMRLFMWIAASDSLYYWTVASCYFMCKTDLPILFDFTMWTFTPDWRSKYHALFLLFNSMQVIVLFGVVLSLCFNSCLIFDLLIMIKYPFSDK